MKIWVMVGGCWTRLMNRQEQAGFSQTFFNVGPNFSFQFSVSSNQEAQEHSHLQQGCWDWTNWIKHDQNMTKGNSPNNTTFTFYYRHDQHVCLVSVSSQSVVEPWILTTVLKLHRDVRRRLNGSRTEQLICRSCRLGFLFVFVKSACLFGSDPNKCYTVMILYLYYK